MIFSEGTGVQRFFHSEPGVDVFFTGNRFLVIFSQETGGLIFLSKRRGVQWSFTRNQELMIFLQETRVWWQIHRKLRFDDFFIGEPGFDDFSTGNHGLIVFSHETGVWWYFSLKFGFDDFCHLKPEILIKVRPLEFGMSQKNQPVVGIDSIREGAKITGTGTGQSAGGAETFQKK